MNATHYTIYIQSETHPVFNFAKKSLSKSKTIPKPALSKFHFNFHETFSIKGFDARTVYVSFPSKPSSFFSSRVFSCRLLIYDSTGLMEEYGCEIWLGSHNIWLMKVQWNFYGLFFSFFHLDYPWNKKWRVINTAHDS